MLTIRGLQLASLWACLALLLVMSRLLARVVRMVGCPPLVGALLAGVIVSHSALGALWPPVSRWLLPATPAATDLLGGIVNVSLLFVCFVLGLETDVGLLHRLGRQLPVLAATSLVVPLAAGAGLGAATVPILIGPQGTRASTIVLLGAVAAVSSLPVIAWTLRELGVHHRPVGQLAIGVATIHDAAGFVLLAVGVGLARRVGETRLLEVGGGLTVIATLVVGGAHRLADALLRHTDPEGQRQISAVLGVIVATMLICAALTQAVHLDGALGAFIAGVAFGRSAYHRHEAARVLDELTTGVFAPLYFAAAGISLRLATLAHPATALELGGLVVVATASKVLGSFVGSRLCPRPVHDARFLATVLNGRGAMQVIIAGVALRHSVLTSSAYTVIVTAAIIATALMAPVARRLVGSPAEPAGPDALQPGATPAG